MGKNMDMRKIINNMDNQTYLGQDRTTGNRQYARRAAAANQPQKVTGLGERGADNFMPKKREPNLVNNM